MNDQDSSIRAMRSEDLEQVIALDAASGGLHRDDFFQRRWQAMEESPQVYVGLVAASGDTVNGFVLGHILTGEFGEVRPLAIIDSIAVDPRFRRGGVGSRLMEALKAEATERDCSEIRTVADWGRQDLLAFFSGSGFSLAPLEVLETNLDTN